MINLKKLIPTHNSLRNILELQNMYRNYNFDFKSSKIHIVEIENKLYVHDGHHRIIAKILRNENLNEEEIKYSKFTLEGYTNPNPPIWITPFNPKIECRIPDFWRIKNAYSIDYILANRHLYIEKRNTFSMKELAEKYEKIIFN